MFDIGFSELVVLAIVGLVVIGPERLPKVAYSLGVWFGKLQRMIRNARWELEREFDTEEFRQMIEKQEAEIRGLKNLLREVQDDEAVDDLLGEIKKHNEQHQISNTKNKSDVKNES